jgi:hypothetical protein
MSWSKMLLEPYTAMLGERQLIKSWNTPFRSNKAFNFQELRIGIYVCFRTNGNDISIPVVTNDTWNLGITADRHLPREPGKGF